MKLSDLKPIIDETTNVRIFTQYDKDIPAFEGYFMDIPWFLMDHCTLGFTEEDKMKCLESECPIELFISKNQYNKDTPYMNIYVIEED